ncbi:MAG: ATP-binding protein [Myxococcota bacterium]
MEELHSVLKRQLKRVGIDDLAESPDPKAWADFIERVDLVYASADEDRYRLERSLDISSQEMEQLHAQLVDERDKLHGVLAALSDGICYLSRDWGVQFLNTAGEQMLGVSHGEAHGRSLFEFIGLKLGASGRVRTCGATFEEELQAGQRFSYSDAKVVHHGGHTFPAQLTFNPMVRDGEVSGIVLKITDITDKKQAQSKIRKAQGEAEQAREAREAQAAFLANMSHELRTPLNAILGYSELVTEDAETLGYAELTPDLEKIRLAGKHLLSLISDVLDMSKIQAGKLELDLEQFQVRELVADVTAMCEQAVRENNSQLVVECSEQVAEIRTDRTKLRQVLVNLLSNAGKFTEGGTVGLSVTTRREHDRDWLIFEISDTGIGIDQEKIAELFEAFTQADGSTTRKYGGTGLGLAISKNFCEVLGGDIEVESALGEGTTFRVKIPSGQVDTNAREKLASQTLQGLQFIVPDESGLDLLVIDDDPSTHELIQRFLSDRDVKVHSALSGGEGVQMVRELEPGLIIIDVVMPEMDGWEVLTELKTDSATAGVPIVIGSIIHEESKAYELGADDYLVKPFERKRLNTIVTRYGG